MSAPTEFLADLDGRRISLQGTATVNARLFIGRGQMGVEIVVYETPSTPTNTILRSLWRARNNSRPTPVVVVAIHDSAASFCGASGEEPPVFLNLDVGQVERLCREVLACPDRNQALIFFGRNAESLTGQLPGIRNEGLLSKHELVNRTPSRPDWAIAGQKAVGALGKKDDALLKTLGFSITRCDNHTSFLTSANKKLALAVLLEEHEMPEAGNLRFAGLSPVTYAMAKADEERLPYVVTVNGPNIRLYSTALNTGVGRRGRTETYIEANSNLLPNDKAALLWLLFSAQALEPNGSLKQILEESTRYAGTLAENLRERIYGKVIPKLAEAVVDARKLKNPSADQLSETYEIALIILFRLLFIAYAEDKDLLPFRFNGLYQKRSLKTKAIELLETLKNNTPFEGGCNLWAEIQLLFSAVDQGNKTWGVPHYNGGLFSKDPEVSKSGYAISKIQIPDSQFGQILSDLLLIEQDGVIGPVDFASLGVREFGTVYEGLLESELSLADTDLALNSEEAYVPASSKSKVVVKKGQVYLHNSSGVRKSTGSYFTKDFAVQYLIDRSLVPALKDHFNKLDKLDDTKAAENLFDFKIADIAMGSGHFLTAAIDRMEADISSYLAKRPLKGVKDELDVLRRSAREALGDIADQIGHIEDDNLLRRLIARRCIYGVDLNPLSVQLARLAVWIHTFVPGLPLSLLDRNLVVGNSLIGIGTISEIQKRFEEVEFGEDELKLTNIDAKSLLADATNPLQRLASINDATYEDIERARKAIAQAEVAVEPAKALCDIITGLSLVDYPPEETRIERGMPLAEQRRRSTLLEEWNRKNETLKRFRFDEWHNHKDTIVGCSAHKRAITILKDSPPFHFPIAFPEVFLRGDPGFDVILGNPPWEEITIEEKGFWTRFFPGLKGLTQREYENTAQKLRKQRQDLYDLFKKEFEKAKVLRRFLTSGFRKLGAGDPDLYKAFVWRFWDLIRSTRGEIGVVLPRSALNSKGSSDFRRGLFDESARIDCCILLNTREWVFDGVEPRYTISLTNISRNPNRKSVVILRGPFSSSQDFYKGIQHETEPISHEKVKSWNEFLSFPLLPGSESLNVFSQLRKSAPLEYDDGKSWLFRPNSEFHATNDKNLFDLESQKCPTGYWPVYKGESFDIWNPDTGTYYAWANPKKANIEIFEKRQNNCLRKGSPFYGLTLKDASNQESIPSLHPRIAFRDITNRTNSRTFIPALVPGATFLTNTAPYFIRIRGNESDEAFLLGILSSIPLDWYSRRYIELHANLFLINPFPIPRPDENNIYRKRVIEISGRLSCIDKRFAKWAVKVGVEVGPVDEGTKSNLICELDAVVAHLYGLNGSQLTHIFETFHAGWDCSDRLKKTLSHYDNWKK